MAVVFAVFQSSSRMPSSNDFLSIFPMGMFFFKILGCILSGPYDLLSCKALTIFEIFFLNYFYVH